MRVLHWNVLAQQLTGVEAFPLASEEVMTWEHRSELFKEEFFKKLDGENYFWDLICLQECDRHSELFENHEAF